MYENKKLTDKSLDELANHHNIAELLQQEDLDRIGVQALADYNTDERSRYDWLMRYERNMKLAAQVMETKSYPWPGASNVKYPLLLNAGLQFHARAYPALIPATNVVTGKVIGKDEDGEKKKRAERISSHMTYQLLDEMEHWERDMDRLLITLPFTGTEFKKTYFDPAKGKNCSEHVFAKDLVVNYYAKTIESAPRKTEILYLSRNELVEKQRQGFYLNFELNNAPVPSPTTQGTVQDTSKGVTKPSIADGSTPYCVLEQHGYYDMDGDGYSEPYICTFLKDTGKVLRIVARYYPESVFYTEDESQIARIDAIEYYTLFQFIPNPCGGIYGIGFGDLLGPLNHSVDTIINQLIDAGSLSNLQPGFISRNLRIKGGSYRFQPGEWKNVNATGQDIKQGLFPLPLREPSGTLFTLLEFLVSAGERVSSTTDLQVGENPGQNQKVGTTQIVQANGLKVFTAIYKRIRKSLEDEFKKLYSLNKLYLNPEEYFTIVNPTQRDMQTMNVTLSDYQAQDVGIVPSADPNLASQELKLARAQYLGNLVTLGGFNEYEVKRRLLEAGDIERPDEVLPPPDSPNAPQPPPNPDLLKLQLDAQKEANEENERAFRRNYDTAKLQMEANAKNIELHIKATEADTKMLKEHGHIANTAAKVKVDAMGHKLKAKAAEAKDESSSEE